jgi:hypothetical protein
MDAKEYSMGERGWRGAILGLTGLALAAAFWAGSADAQVPERTERLTERPEVKDTVRWRGARQFRNSNKTRRLRMLPGLRRQLQAIGREKRSWTPRQRKIAPHLLMEYKKRRGMAMQVRRLPGTPVKVDQDSTTLVDIKGSVTPAVLSRIRARGGVILNSHPRYDAIRARVPIEQLEDIADTPEIRSIRLADRARTRMSNVSQGDTAHRADTARTNFGVDGTGKKACVLSDSVDFLAQVQATSDLPPAIDILPGQAGSGSGEGTAMLEIVHDLAPGAALGFATAFGGQAQFAQNILDLRFNAGCDVIVDDVIYFAEPVFQDGAVSAAVDAVAADGALFFSSIGNGNNFNEFAPNSGTWEGDFNPGPDLGTGLGISHDWTGGGANLNAIAFTPDDVVVLQWSDPFGGSGNDYDLHIVNPAGDTIVASSVAVQDGIGNPFEIIDLPIAGQPADLAGFWVLVTKFSGQDRMLHLNLFGGLLGVATESNAYGHATARGAIGVAAVQADNLGGAPFLGSGANQVEFFSSDGPRRIHYEANGAAITPGNFSSTGGEVRQKPEIAAADRVATATPGFASFAGTSAAAPHAAAIATLALSLPSNPGPTVVRDTMFNTAIDIEAPGIDRDSGYGIVDAVATIEALALPDLVAEWVKLKPASCPGGVGPPSLIFQSSIGDHDSPSSGFSVFPNQFFGTRFTLGQPYTITRIGARFFPIPTPPAGSIFGALVDLNSSNFPSSTPLTIDADKLIASTVFTPTYGADFLTPLSATIGPGTYGVVFGSGLFGTTGSQAITSAQAPFTSNGTIIWSGTLNWQDTGGVNAERIIVEGQLPAPPDQQTGTTACRFKGKLAVANKGIAPAVNSTARIFYSSDTTLDPAGDIQLAEFPVSALAVNGVQVNPIKLSVPGVTNINPNSTVYVQLDVTGAVPELDEINNIEDISGF